MPFFLKAQNTCVEDFFIGHLHSTALLWSEHHAPGKTPLTHSGSALYPPAEALIFQAGQANRLDFGRSRFRLTFPTPLLYCAVLGSTC